MTIAAAISIACARQAADAPERLTPVSAFFDKIAYTKDGTQADRGARIEDASHAHARGFRRSQRRSPSSSTSGCRPRAERRRGLPGWRAATPSRAATRRTSGRIPSALYVWSGGSDGLLSVRCDGTDFKTVLKVSAPAPPAPAGAPPATSTPDEVQHLAGRPARARARESQRLHGDGAANRRSVGADGLGRAGRIAAELAADEGRR